MGDAKMKDNIKTIKIGNRRVTLLAASLILALCLAIGGTVAYLLTRSAMVTNTFVPGNVDVEFDNSTGEVIFKGNVDAYVRVTVTGNWAKDDHVHPHTPDWSMTMTEDWEPKTQGDITVFYYKHTVHPGDPFPRLKLFTVEPHLEGQGQTPPQAGYVFTYEVGAQSIQTEPQQALTDANWAYVPQD
jgi:hypothetical protein